MERKRKKNGCRAWRLTGLTFGLWSPVGDGLAFTLGLEGGGLGGTRGGQVELSFLSEVLEVGAGGEEDVDDFDVAVGEFVSCLGTIAGEGEPEITEIAESYLAASKKAFSDAAGNGGEDGGDVFLIVLGVVVDDVLGEGVEAEDLRDLSMGIGFLRFVRLLGVGLHGNGVVDHS